MPDQPSQDFSKQYDLSFAYSYHWNYPEADIHRALKILLRPDLAENELSVLNLGNAQDIRRIRCLLSSNPNTPAPVLEHLVACAEPSVLERIAENPSTSAETLARLSCHTSAEVRCAVAENLNSTTETIEKLSMDECADVRFRLAENHNTPTNILERLSRDDNPFVAFRAQKTMSRIAPASIAGGKQLTFPQETGSASRSAAV